MDSFLVFNNFLSIKLHFTNKKYDAITHNFKTRVNKTTFEKRKDKSFFYLVGKQFKDEDNLRDFFISNIVYRNLQSPWIGDFVNEIAKNTYTKYISLSEGFTYAFQNDIINLRNRMLSAGLTHPDSMINNFENGTDFPIIINELIYSNIEIESFLMINRVLNFLDSINKKICNKGENIIWVNLYNRLNKYDRLMKPLIDKNKAATIILNTFKKEIQL